MQIVGYQEKYAEKLSEIVVRNLMEVNSKDYPMHEIRRMILNFGPEHIQSFAAKREIFVAAEGDEPVGILTVVPSRNGKKGEYHFLTVFVQPECHRKGIGRSPSLPPSLPMLSIIRWATPTPVNSRIERGTTSWRNPF